MKFKIELVFLIFCGYAGDHIVFTKERNLMSDLNTAKQITSTLIRTFEGVLKNFRELSYQLGRDTYMPDGYRKSLLLNSEEVSKILGKNPTEVEQTFGYLKMKKHYNDGETCYSLLDVLTYIRNSLDHIVSVPLLKGPEIIHDLFSKPLPDDEEDEDTTHPHLTRMPWKNKPIPNHTMNGEATL